VRALLAEHPLMPATSAEPSAPANTPGIRRIMFAVEDIEDVLARLHAAELVGELERYEDSYRLCYVRGPRASSSRWPSSSAEAFEAVTTSTKARTSATSTTARPDPCVGKTSSASTASTTNVIIWLE